MRILDRMLLGIAGLSLLLMFLIFFSDESHLSAKPLTANNSKATPEMPVSLNNLGQDFSDLKSEDVDNALESYFEEIRKNPERGEEDLRLVDELQGDDLGLLDPLKTSEGHAQSTAPSLDAEPTPAPKKKTEQVEIMKHIVKAGESIWRLSIRYGIPVQTIVNANKIKEKSVIQQGDVLRIPDRAGVFYKIKKRETLGEIAKRFKLEPQAIKKANGLSSSLIAKGDELFLPGAKPLPEYRYVKQKVFIWPIKAKYRLTSRYGWRMHPIRGIKAFHSGIDIGAQMRTPIHAAAAGVVVYAGEGGSYGNMVILRHKNGLYTVYGHASKLIAKKGRYVKRGQKIALVGSTGASTGPHLHFEVKSGKKFVSPFQALKKTERVAVKNKDA